MKSKELSITKLEQIKGILTNVKTCAYRGDRAGFEKFIESLEDRISELEDLINSEPATYSNKPYQGL